MVNIPIRIGVTGAHSTGKTILLRRIEMELRAEGIRVARTGGLGKRAATLGLPTMDRHTAASTEWIMAQGIADEIAAAHRADVVLADRVVIDAVAYWHAAVEFRGEPLDPGDDERLRLLAATQSAKYDLLLATVLDPSAPIEPKRHAYDPRYRSSSSGTSTACSPKTTSTTSGHPRPARRGACREGRSAAGPADGPGVTATAPTTPASAHLPYLNWRTPGAGRACSRALRAPKGSAAAGWPTPKQDVLGEPRVEPACPAV